MKTVVAIFDRIEDARYAVEDLVDSGIQRDNISLIARDVEGHYGTQLEGRQTTAGEDVGQAAAGGAAGGAVLGGLAGVLVGLGALTIPGIGPAVAAGPIISGLTGAAVGAAAGGLLGALVEWGIPEEEAEYYAEGVRRGGTLVAVRAADEDAEDVVDLLESYDPVDIERRSEFWRSEENWTGYDPNAAPYDAAQIEQYRQQWQSDYEEYDTEDYDYDLGSTRFEEFEPRFRSHYDTAFSNTDYTYDQYTPAYRYGHSLALDPRYRDVNDWNELEGPARRSWEEQNQGMWEEFKDAVRHGWNETKRNLS